MLTTLAQEGKKVGLQINAKKCICMTNSTATPLILDGQPLGFASSFKYLGQLVSFEKAMGKEIDRRRAASWGAYNKYRGYFGNQRISMVHKRKLYNSCVLPAMIYGAETWNCTRSQLHDLRTTQRRMERAMCGVNLRHRLPSATIRTRTGVMDVVSEAIKRKWNWGRRVATMDGDRWPRVISEWTPRQWSRSAGQPKRRWSDDFSEAFGPTWMRTARTAQNLFTRTGLQAATSL